MCSFGQKLLTSKMHIKTQNYNSYHIVLCGKDGSRLDDGLVIYGFLKLDAEGGSFMITLK